MNNGDLAAHFAYALQREHGLLGPYVEVAWDAFLLAHVYEPAVLLMRPWEVCGGIGGDKRANRPQQRSSR